MINSKTVSLRLPSKEDTVLATEALSQLKRGFNQFLGTQKISLAHGNGDPQIIEVPAIALQMFVGVLVEISLGNTIKITSIPAILTSQEAAELLDISRPKLVKLLDDGVIPYTKKGTHRRVSLNDIMIYKGKRDADNLASIEALAAQAQKLGMGY